MTPRHSVSVLGAGLMGSAVARFLHRTGCEVSVWTRTPERADLLVAEGLRYVESAAAAIEASAVSILLLPNFDAARPVLNAGQRQIAGKTIVNLMTGGESDARACADVVARAGGRYIDGAIVAYPPQIGDPSAVVLYCGNEAAWEQYGTLLLQLGGRSRWLGSNPGLASILDTAAAGAFFQTSLGAFVEAASYAEARGVNVAVLSALILEQLDGFKATIRAASEAIRAQRWETQEATLDVYLEATRVWKNEMQQAGASTHLIAASLDSMMEAQAAGHGARSFYSQFLTKRSDEDTPE